MTNRWHGNRMTGMVGIIIVIMALFQPAVLAAVQNSPDSVAQLSQAVASARETLKGLERALADARQEQQTRDSQDKLFRTQINSLRNYLIVPDISLSVLAKGIEEVDIAISLVQARLTRAGDIEAGYLETLQSVQEKIQLIDNSLLEADRPTDGESPPRLSDNWEYVSYRSLLEQQRVRLMSLVDLVGKEKTTAFEMLESFREIRAGLETRLKRQKGNRLFQRQKLTFKMLSPGTLYREITLTLATIQAGIGPETISASLGRIQDTLEPRDGIILLGFVLLYLLYRQGWQKIRSSGRYRDIIAKRTGYPLQVVEGSLHYGVLLLLVWVVSKTSIYMVLPDLIHFLETFLLVMLLTRMAPASVRIIVEEEGHAIFRALLRWEHFLVSGVRIYTLVYLIFYRFLSPESPLLVIVRVISELVLVWGVFLFWKRYYRRRNSPPKIGIRCLDAWSRVVVVLGLFAEMSGYAPFAAWWYMSWGITIFVACFSVLLVYAMKDMDQKTKQRFGPGKEGSRQVLYPVYWMLSNGVYLLIITFAVTGLVFSWGAGERFFVFVWSIINKSYVMGKVELSLAGIFRGILAIVLTYFSVRLWKRVMDRYILKESGLSTGAKESVITISVYLIWAAGILLALSVFGLDTTSLTVAFGALGIGLGFGLQNIFSNFVSGLILLFERPIQVGDVVEVGGIWGEVKKINVRSTLVQTYTNSSLIIPNSEFISASVTNWSHRDPYIRRDLLVGVAYGSDTALVKDTLMAAADDVQEVYHYPRKPQVHFINFGESSLDFRLRFWSDIDNFITAESRLRFEVDRRFRELGIVIPFPQRDLHIIDGEIPPPADKAVRKDGVSGDGVPDATA